ncbi:MAG TPA: hypothetical protein VK509_02835, partial [Polyangiales bacterium]|nr:hypothetical protein [Polyangiales bacterium]
RLGFALACSHALGCRETASGDVVTVRIRAASEPIAAGAIRYEPADDVRSARLGAQGWLAIERRRSARPLMVRVPGFCPLAIAPGKQTQVLALRPVIDLGSDRPALGFDAAFSVTVQHGCAERGRGQISWRQLEGPPLAELSVSHDGFQLSARTPSLAVAHPQPLPAGIVPFSPRTQGRVVLQASWQGPGLPAVKRTLAIRATSRASGLSSVAVSQQLMLSGAGFRVQSAPLGGHAQVHARGSLSQFTPDAPGRWVLARESGQPLVLQAFWHDKTPYDCGRSECHAAIAATTLASPMSRALQAPLGATGPAAVSCMLECHVVGERGSDDGGFLDVAAELGWTWLDSSRWQDLPQPLRRLGGVRCTACHGPGAIPEPDAREQILRADVCATCHDAPPQYGHVQQWRASRMARSDAAAGTREPGCAACHTTAGFLDDIGARSTHATSVASAPAGVACAACHAPHAPHTGARLIRPLPASEPQLEPQTAICLRCHSPVAGELQPSASSGALWLGSARVPVRDRDAWELVTFASAHRAVPAGCVGCHGKQPAAEGGKLDHSFRADPARCAGCHDDASERRARVQDAQRGLLQRAMALALRLAEACPSSTDEKPRHAHGTSERCRTQPLTRARFELGLVLEDPAAASHNAAFAHILLDDAERQLSPNAD